MRRELLPESKLKKKTTEKHVLKIKTWWICGNNGEANAAHGVLTILGVWE